MSEAIDSTRVLNWFKENVGPVTGRIGGPLSSNYMLLRGADWQMMYHFIDPDNGGVMDKWTIYIRDPRIRLQATLLFSGYSNIREITSY